LEENTTLKEFKIANQVCGSFSYIPTGNLKNVLVSIIWFPPESCRYLQELHVNLHVNLA